MAVGTNAPAMDAFEDAAEDSGVSDAILLDSIEQGLSEEEDEEEEYAPLYEPSDDDEEEEDSSEEEDSDDEDENEEEEEAPEEEAPKSRAQKRIQALVDEKKEYQARLEAQERQFQQQLQHQQAIFEEQRRVAAHQEAMYRQQQEYQQRQIELLYAQEEEEFKKRDPVAYYEQQLVEKAYQKARSETSQEIEALKQQFESYQQGLQRQAREAQEAAARQERFSYYEQDTHNTINELYPDAQDDPELFATMEETLIAMAAAHGKLPSQVATQFQKLANSLSSNHIKSKSKSKTKGQRIKSAKKLPGSSKRGSPAGASGSEAGPRPSYKALKAAGYNDFFEWREADCPPLPEQ